MCYNSYALLGLFGNDGLQYTSLAGLILCKKLYCYSLLWLWYRRIGVPHALRAATSHRSILVFIYAQPNESLLLRTLLGILDNLALSRTE